MTKRLNILFLLFLGIVLVASPHQSFGVNMSTISYESLYGENAVNQQEAFLSAKEKAFELARLLDGGRYKGELIRTTSVFNYSDEEFYIVATLGNGLSVKMYMDILKKATASYQLELPNNHLLLFPNDRYNDFVVFDKSEFFIQALKAKYLKRTYPLFHPLENLSFIYRIKKFQYQPKSKTPYVFEMLNNEQMKFDIKGAHTLLTENQLISEFSSAEQPILNLPYYISRVRTFNKIPFELGLDYPDHVKKFGIQVTFDQEIALTNKYFPVLIEKMNDDFTINVLLPNSVLRKNAMTYAQPTEYINRWKFVQNSRDNYGIIKATLLSKNLAASDYFTYRPIVYLHPDRKNLFITFFQDLNQTLDYAQIEQGKQYINGKQIEKNPKLLAYPSKLESKFVIEFNKGVTIFTQAESEPNWSIKKTTLLASLEAFRSAGLFANSEKQIQHTLNYMQTVRKTIYHAVLQNEVYPLLEQDFLPNDGVMNDLYIQIAQFSYQPQEKDTLVQDLKILVDVKNQMQKVSGLATNSLYNETDKQAIQALKKQLIAELNKISKYDQRIFQYSKRLKTNLNKLKIFTLIEGKQ